MEDKGHERRRFSKRAAYGGHDTLALRAVPGPAGIGPDSGDGFSSIRQTGRQRLDI